MVETQASSVLLGIFLGPEAVGLYRFAERLVTTVVGVTTNAVHTVSLPQFSRQQNNPDELRRSVLHCIRLSAALTLPALSGLAVAAHPLIHLVGSNWSPAADTLAILVPGAMLMIFASFAGPLLQATGDPRRLAVLEWGRACLSIVLFVITGYIVQFHALRWQLAGFALSRFVLAAFAIAPLYILVLMRVARIPLRQFFLDIMPATLASAAIVTVCLLLSNAGLVPKDRYLPQLVIETIAGGCIGAAVIFSLDSRVRDIVVSLYQRRYSLRSQ
jgi:PST family polysaccharide transporter